MYVLTNCFFIARHLRRWSKFFTCQKTPYLLTLALSKFLLEFIIQPIRSGSRSEKSNYPKLKDTLNSYIRFSIPFLGVDDMSWIFFAAFAHLFERDGS
jgi:hypothetical protein